MSVGMGAEGRVVRLYRRHFGRDPERVARLVPDGSARRYFRLEEAGGRTVVGAYGPDAEENRAFLSFSRSFREIGLPVPEIFAEDIGAGVWLEEDLGDTTLYDLLAGERRRSGGRLPEAASAVYRRTVEVLPRFQVEGARAVDFEVAYPRAAFDRQSILWDLNYFKYHFLKLAHVRFNEERLERDFDRFTGFLLQADRDHFLYRDFQSRNVMVRDGEPWFIDYQGGRRGALQYDLASLLWDAKADLPDEFRRELLHRYLGALGERLEVDRDSFLAHYPGYVIVRIMQAMGAYGYRGFYEGKARFLQSVPYAARNIRTLLERGLPVRLPEVEAVFVRIVEDWAPPEAADSAGDALTVHVGSFSYRGGYPRDMGEHGGGFVFDCRALPNPGREEAYRTVTGRDGAVAGWLEDRPETASFWGGARDLVDAQVREYLRRGFTSLSVQFGCTGGQHRSVYLAERLARHLGEQFPGVRVRVKHRERSTWPRVPPTEEKGAAAPGGGPAAGRDAPSTART